MVILGIDPGIATIGYAVILLNKKDFSVIDYGHIETKKGKEFSQRLLEIYQDLNKLIKKYRPEQVAVENLYFAKNAKTAINVGQARGVVMLAAAENKIQVFECTPLQVKQALTGYGQAPKAQIQKMVKAVCGLKLIPKPDDAADALAIAITCAQTKIF